jgi:outer membrane protein assembly factor BamB
MSIVAGALAALLISSGTVAAGGASAQVLPVFKPPTATTPAPTPTPALPTPPVLEPPAPGDETVNDGVDATRRGALRTAPVFPLRSRWRFDLPVAAAQPPLVAGGRVFTTSGSTIVAIDLKTGKQDWVSAVTGELAYGAGGLFVAGSGRIVALDPASGQQRWSISLDFTGPTGPVVAGDLVIAQGQGLFAVDAASGALRWKGGTRDGTNGEPAVVGDRVYQAGGCTIAAADRRNGVLLWNRNNGCGGGGGGRVVTWRDEAIASGLSTEYGPLAALDGTDRPGALVRAIGGDIGLREKDELQAVDVATGKVRWRVGTGSAFAQYGRPAIFGGTVLRAQFSGPIEARRLSDGKLLWAARLRAPKSPFTGSSDEAVDIAGAGGVVVVSRGATIDALEAGPRRGTGALGAAFPRRRAVLVGASYTVHGRVTGALRPQRVQYAADPYPYGRTAPTKRLGASATPDDAGRYKLAARLDVNTRLRVVDAAGSAKPSKTITVYAYPTFRFSFTYPGASVRAHISVRGGRTVRFRGRRMYLYHWSAARKRGKRLGSARITGPARGKGVASILYPEIPGFGRRDYVFTCIVGIGHAGNGAPRYDKDCGSAVVR